MTVPGYFDDRDEDEFGIADPELERERRRRPTERCSPDKLLAFLKQTREETGKEATLAQIKGKFGGLIGPFIDYWELKRRGIL